MTRNSLDKEMIKTVAALGERVDHLILNHLPHLQTRLDKIETKMDRAGWYIITTLIGILIAVWVR